MARAGEEREQHNALGREARFPFLQKAAYGGIALEAYGDIVGAMGFFASAVSGEKFGARGPIGLIFPQAWILRNILQGGETGGGAVQFGHG